MKARAHSRKAEAEPKAETTVLCPDSSEAQNRSSPATSQVAEENQSHHPCDGSRCGLCRHSVGDSPCEARSWRQSERPLLPSQKRNCRSAQKTAGPDADP